MNPLQFMDERAELNKIEKTHRNKTHFGGKTANKAADQSHNRITFKLGSHWSRSIPGEVGIDVRLFLDIRAGKRSWSVHPCLNLPGLLLETNFLASRRRILRGKLWAEQREKLDARRR